MSFRRARPARTGARAGGDRRGQESTVLLQDLVTGAAERRPDADAVVDAGDGARITYGALDALANRLARALRELGARRGDRVGIWLPKSPVFVAAMQAALRLGAIYVPLDPLSPAARVHAIARDCAMRVVVSTGQRMDALRALDPGPPRCLDVDVSGRAWQQVLALPAAPLDEPRPRPEDCAYVLYTSGSTGGPKGVRISHRSALAFVRWAAGELGARPDDRFANHAPFHFDLSILDLYGAFAAGAGVILIPDMAAYAPTQMVRILLQHRVTIWYSVPSALILMMERGGLLDVDGLGLRAILFAGEVFPVAPLRRLVARFAPRARLLNLYGPTETNVCTFYELRPEDAHRDAPVPIGQACSGDRVWARRDDGAVAGPGEDGELMCAGPTVMLGYWGAPDHGDAPYVTGDIVRLEPDGNYTYIGRRDSMVKVRGHRVELGEIETVLCRHPGIREAAVIVSGAGADARLVAFLVPGTAPAPTLLALKGHCAQHLPSYMNIHAIRVLPALPRTRNGKLDRISLRQRFAGIPHP